MYINPTDIKSDDTESSATVNRYSGLCHSEQVQSPLPQLTDTVASATVNRYRVLCHS